MDKINIPLILKVDAKLLADEIHIMKKYKIYQDLDGCLVDFENGYHQYTGVPCKGVLGEDGNWVNGPDFWKLIDYVDFWAELDWMSDGRELWNYISRYDVEILSAPSKSETSTLGKKAWMSQHLPYTPLNLVPRWKKMEFAGPNHILIDDMTTTIDEWNRKGGIGILHTTTENTIKQLKELGL